MCEIFAINARRPLLANAYLREFFADSPKHPHGWGLAWDTSRGLWLDKEPLPAFNSEYLSYLLRESIRTRWLIAHIRNATRGVVTYDNCHPFHERDVFGEDWMLAHNGTLLEDALVAPFESSQRGSTDSERVVLYLLSTLTNLVQNRQANSTYEQHFALFEQAIERLSKNNKLNLVFGNGTYTYVHTNTLQHTLWRYHGNGLALFCTRPLGTGEDWEPVPRCRLIVYRDGEELREGTQHSNSFDDDFYLRIIEEERSAGGKSLIAALKNH